MIKEENLQLVVDRITQFLSDKKTEARVNGFAVGVSGGVDSALVSTLCAETKIRTRLINMPIYQTHAELERAEKHMNYLRNNYKNVVVEWKDLTKTFNTFVDEDLAIPDYGRNEKVQFAKANLRSRLRMCCLYFYANLFNFLVVGTGNKDEDHGVRFFTKYGDGGVDLSPIADLHKSEVRQLANFMNVNPDTVNANPTDGLWDDGRTDEDQLGLTYNQIEQISKHGHDSGYDNDLIELYYKYHNNNAHKMEPIPVVDLSDLKE